MWFRQLIRFSSSFSSKDIKIRLTTAQKSKPVLNEKLLFGTALTDHLLEINWTDADGWDIPHIEPYHNFMVDPAASVLHYGTECFEGLKAYRTAKNNILLFRPEMNMSRFKRSAAAVALPDFDGDELLKCIDELLKVEESWIPNKIGYSLYIRPAFFGNQAGLGVSKPRAAKLFVVCSTVGPYFPEGFKPIHLYCDETIARAFPGGSGDKKIGANYAPGIGHTAKLQSKGFNQILWLCNSYVSEAGTMNFFVYWKNAQGENELATCELDGTILPGVTRDSILTLAREWNEFKITEKKFTIYELCEALDNGRVIEAFGAGTACIVSPVNKITFKDKEYKVPLALGNAGLLTKRFQDEILKIQYGEIRHNFQHLVI